MSLSDALGVAMGARHQLGDALAVPMERRTFALLLIDACPRQESGQPVARWATSRMFGGSAGDNAL